MDVPKQVQDKLAQFQNMQNQLHVVSMQKQQLMLQNTDLDNARKEVEPLKGEKIYRMVGPILIETTKEAGVKYLTDEKDLSEAKIKMLEKQEKKLVERLNEMRGELQNMLQPTNNQ
ncbi:MAG: prefoldin subunit beta [Candidatus Altiarchaeota archaeon]